jgi:hypothetical protein
MKKIEFDYHKYDADDFIGKRLEIEYIVDLMAQNGFSISYLDAYYAWYSGNNYVWEHPFDYEEGVVVDEVLAACGEVFEVEFHLAPEDTYAGEWPTEDELFADIDDDGFVSLADLGDEQWADGRWTNLPLTDEDWDALEQELDDYEPSDNKQVEAADTDDFDTFMDKKYH